MSDTIPGGAYQTANGQWVDSGGNPLNKEQIVEAKKLDSERDLLLRAAERAKLEAEARRDPTARALAAALRPQAEPAPAAERAADTGASKATK